MTDGETIVVKCKTHGETPWGGWLVCDHCKRLVHEERDDYVHVCTCGKPFSPKADEDRFTARLACDGCVEVIHLSVN